MKRLTVLFLFLLACTAIAAVALRARTYREPTYKGRTLSQWLESGSSMQDAPRVHAIQQIGTNALPLLLEWIQYRPSPLEFKISGWLSKLHIDPTFNKMSRPQAAVVAFAALGEEAKPAIPALVSIIDSTNSSKRLWAVDALAAIGTEAFPTMVDVVTNSMAHTNWDRLLIAVAFFRLNTNAFLAKPALLAHVRDANPQVARAAIFVLGTLASIQQKRALPPETTADIVPALSANLDTTNMETLLRTIDALRNFSSNALPAVPALMQKLTCTDQVVRSMAAAALNEIDPQALQRAQKQ